MYSYTLTAIGTTAGGISGWCLVWAYLFIGTAGMTGFTIFANVLLGMMGFQIPDIVMFAICGAVIWLLAHKDIGLSNVLMLILEGASVVLILLLCAIVLFHCNFIDTAQIELSGAFVFGNQPGRRCRNLQPSWFRVRNRL